MNKKSTIRLGNQTSFSAPQFDTPFNFAVLEGFSAFEFFPDKREDGSGWAVSEISKMERGLIRKKAAEADISLSLHLPWQANPLKEDFNLILNENLLFASDIGASLIIIHLYGESGIDAYIREALPAIEATHKRGMGLAIENTPLTSPAQFNALFEKLEEVDIVSSHVGMCLDIGHANLHESTRNDYLAYMDSLASNVPLIHGHIHENYGESDSHLTLFTGPSRNNSGGISGVVRRLTERNFEGALIFEQWPEPSSLLIEAKRELEKIIVSHVVEDPILPVEELPSPTEPGDLVAEFIDFDRENRNWRGKLNALLYILNGDEVGEEHFALAAIYLSFMGRGELELSEDGGHYRPSHHARAARDVERRLAELATSENYYIMKRIYPWLPSHDEKFTAAEPLTRIRDIAHRNDIPRELKDEIKHSLQNKLHRCAGPEDLITSERILKRVTAPGTHYSASFVEEFITFHNELKEFFNAESLTELLEKIVAGGYTSEEGSIRDFLTLREEEGESSAYLIKLLDKLTNLRMVFYPLHWKRADERAQKLRIADIALDGLAFVISSRLDNALSVASENISGGEIKVLSLLIENLRINRIYPEESEVVKNELESLIGVFSNAKRDDLLRLRASLERVIRISDSHAARLLKLFQSRAVQLGEGIKVRKSAIRFFSEGSIRGDLIFQLAKYASSLLRRVKSLLKMVDWETLFPGEAVGRLTDSGGAGFTVKSYKEPVILVASDISGEEEIPPGVTGIILKESIPLLSHLGIRAREQGVVFVICEDEESEKRYSPYMGRVVRLSADTRRLAVKPFMGKIEIETPKGEARLNLEKPELAGEISLIGLDRVNGSNAGGKAFGLKRLMELSGSPGAGFRVPETLVLPFGAFELYLKDDPDLYGEFKSKMEALGKYGTDEESLASIRELIGRVEVGVSHKALKIFGTERPLIVRSSSNSEDLAQFVGAGLYESVLNVVVDDISSAIKRVVASLWSGRGARRRVGEGLPHDRVFMAVIIQEMLWPELSFIIHSVNPVTGARGEMYIELAPGQGDILTSLSERGRPYRVSVSKGSGDIRMDSFASFSNGDLPGNGVASSRRSIDYSKIPFHTDEGVRRELIKRISECGKGIEEFFCSPQDIEGFIKGGDVYIVQSRSQLL